MNIKVQLCGLIVTCFLLILYKSKKSLHLPGENAFSWVVYLTLLMISLDILSVIAIYYSGVLPLVIVRLICKAYLISMIWAGWTNFCYVMLSLNSTPENHHQSNRIMAAVTALESLITLILPIQIHNYSESAYTSGAAVIAVYIFTLFYIVSTLAVSIYIAKNKNARRGQAMIICAAFWILAAILQATHNEWLVVGFSNAVGVMVLYIVVDNPDSNIDHQIGCYNSYALYEYLDMMLQENRSFGLLEFSIMNIAAFADKGMDPDDLLHSICNHFEHKKGLHLFKDVSTSLVICTEQPEELDRFSSEIFSYLPENTDYSKDLLVITMANPNVFHSSDELSHFITHVKSTSSTRYSSTIHISEELVQRYKSELQTEKDIRDALDENRVEVFYQPICRCSEEKITSAEALARIRNRDGSLMSPGVFIPVAESTGLITAIGERVLELVCDFLKNSPAVHMGINKVDVNLSVVQCDDDAVIRRLLQIVDDYGIDPSLINFEITESAISSARDVLLENMKTLVSKGFTFALDDFGKGESNLIYIVEMPVSVVKLDIDMSKAYINNERARHVVGSIVEMSHRLNLPVIAEGIETREEVDFISGEGIEFIQGYFYSKPLPADDFIRFLEEFEASKSQQDNCAEEEGSILSKEGQDCTHNADGDTDSEAASLSLTSEELQGRRILLVEDNELIRDMEEDILLDLGFQVTAADDGVRAIEILSKENVEHYDYVLMDIRMPIMDGYEACRRIRAMKNKSVATLPIVAITAANNAEDRKQSMGAGMNAHLSKPIDKDKLLDVLSTLQQISESNG